MTRTCLAFAAVLSFTLSLSAAETPAQRDARLQWWREARFGLFIHWGPVSLKGTEIGWSRGAEVPVDEYDALYHRFNPEKFNADDWVAVAKAAGMRYVILTTKHHDGFCLWDTKQTEFNVMNSPLKRDVCKELADACRKQGIPFGTYHSVCDWHHPDFPLTSPGGSVKRPVSNLDRYNDYLLAQVSELVTNYHPRLIWFDVPQQFEGARGQRLLDATRALDPTLIINDRSGAGGDYETPEQRIGAFQIDRPWETCMTLCTQWSWKPNDEMKSLEQCLRALILCAGGDGNLLFNVGPMPTGEIEPRQVQRLKEMGQWLERYGSTIYATRGGPFKPTRSFASTRRDNTIFLHLLSAAPDTLTLPPIARKITASRLLTGGTVTLRQSDEGITLSIPRENRHPIDTIVALDLDGPAADIPPLALSTGSLAAGKTAAASNTFQQMPEYAPAKAFDDDDATRWATDAGTKQAWLQVDLGRPTLIGAVTIDEAYGHRIQKFELQYRAGDEWRPLLVGTTVGPRFHRTFPPTSAQHVRLQILEATEGPTINELQLFKPEPDAH